MVKSAECGEAPTRIYLTGFMAAGKTSVGRELALLLDWRFFDLDTMVEERAGMSVRRIFERRGEAAFRDLEHSCLVATEDLRRVVIATGGGTPTREDNRLLMKRLGWSVWLHPAFDTVSARLDARGKDRRPLFHDEEQARKLYQSRIDHYRQGDLEIRSAAPETAADLAARIAHLFREKFCDI